MVRHCRPALCLAVILVVMGPTSGSLPVAAESPPPVDPRRADFLKLIDRPRVPLNPAMGKPASSNGLAEFHFTYDAEKDQQVPGIMITADASKGRLPVVIALHGTGGKKEDERSLLQTLAKQGFLAVAIDGRYHGERAANARKDAGMNAYDTAVLHAWQAKEPHEHPFFFDEVWDVMRLVDYLKTRDDVDPKRIGLYGVSKGGIETYLTAAVDPRIAVAVPCISVESFKWADEHSSWQSRIGTVQKPFDAAAKAAGIDKPDGTFVATFYSHVAPGIDGEFDGPSMVPLIAPRPLMVINGDSDPRTPAGGLKLAIDATQFAYTISHTDDHFLFRLQPNTAHQVRPESQQAAVDWFVQWLKPEKPSTP